MEVIPACVMWQFAPVYLDNIVIPSKKPEKHIDHVMQMPTILQSAKVKLQIKNAPSSQTQMIIMDTYLDQDVWSLLLTPLSRSNS